MYGDKIPNITKESVSNICYEKGFNIYNFEDLIERRNNFYLDAIALEKWIDVLEAEKD